MSSAHGFARLPTVALLAPPRSSPLSLPLLPLLPLLLLLLLLSLSALVAADCASDYADLNTTYYDLLDRCDALNTSYQTLQQDYAACGCGEDVCAQETGDTYNAGLHIASIIIILVASVAGVVLPLLGKYWAAARIGEYWIILGKCIGTGIVLACALVHMIQPASESLTSPCLPAAFSEDYGAYAFLFALIAAILMQFFDYMVLQYMVHRHVAENAGKQQQQQQQKAADLDNKSVASSSAVEEASGANFSMVKIEPAPAGSGDQLGTQASSVKLVNGHGHGHSHSHGDDGEAFDALGHSHTHVGEFLLNSKIERTLSAYLLEFGITVHSVFIGLTVGVSAEDQLRALLVALTFHQFFEGVALGARLNDAELVSHWQEFALSFIFSISAPLGIMIGVIVTTSINTNGESFLLVQGIFDAICGGILLYIGFILLLKDFPEDIKRVGKQHAQRWRRAGMFIALWAGAGSMAYIGKYL